MKRLLLCILFSLGFFASQAQELYEMISQFRADRSALVRKYTLKESDEYYDRFTKFYTHWIEVVTKVPFNTLSPQGKVDYLLMKNYIEKEVFFLKQDEKEFKTVAHVTDFAAPLYEFVKQRRTGRRPDAPALANVFMQAIASVEAAKSKLTRETPFPSWQNAEKAADVVGSLRVNLKEAKQFYADYDPQFAWWMEKPNDSLNKSLLEYGSVLKKHYVNTSVKDDGSGIIGKPIGREALIRSLQSEFIVYSPEELIAIAEKQFAWCDAEMVKASGAMGFGNNWKSALEKVKNTYVPPGEQPALVNRLAEEAIQFVERNDLVTVPELAKETWRMKMMSPEQQKINPFFLGGEQIIISYPTQTMEHEEKMMSMRGNNPHFSKATVHHELIPGHHLQLFMMQRHKPYRELFSTPFWIEGWALYWELILWDKGFPGSPEDRIGMLFWRMHRCARIIFSLNYHLGKMSPQQCIDFLVDRVGHERANAEAEVRRSFTGRYGPLYQIAYMVGGLQFYGLRKELVVSGKLTEKEFHDRILREGSIPVEIVRAILTGQTVSEDFKTSWRFASE
jgi:hypothetical protein